MAKLRLRETDYFDTPFVRSESFDAMFFLLYRNTFAWRAKEHRTTGKRLWFRPVVDVYVVMVNTQSKEYKRIAECVYKSSYVGSITRKEFFVGKLNGSINLWKPQDA